MKYIIIFVASTLIEVFSTFYIRYASEGNMLGMMFFAFVSPILSIAFAGYMVETKCWKERIKIALSVSLGYVLGVLIVIKLIQ
jgi:hypothetical protein